MARAKAERTRSKSTILEDLSHGIERLQGFIPQIEDVGREGFPYLEGARSRTELQLRECIRKVFGDKSVEYQMYRQHKLSMDTPAETKKSVALVRGLIASLEDKKLEIQGLKPPPSAEPSPPPPPAPTAKPQMTLVPPPTHTAHVTITPAAPVQPPPITMSVALTTNLDMASPSAIVSPTPVSVAPAELSKPQPSPSVAPSVTPEPEPVTPPSAPPAQSTAQATAAEITVLKPPASSDDIPPPTPGTFPPAAEPPMKPVPSADFEDGWSRALPSTFPGPEESGSPITPESSPSSFPKSDSLELVKSLCKRFHVVARQLRLRGEYRATLDVEDEVDVQDLIHALLRLHFDDIGTEEWTPSYSNGAPRMTFLLNDGRLALIVKKTRTGLTTKDLAGQLRIDVEHCRTLKRCSTLLCFVYDPEGRIGNPRGLEADLISISDQLTADVFIAPK